MTKIQVVFEPMKFRFIFSVLSLLSVSLTAQGTFSIVAVDPVTREVGAAGATCSPLSAFQRTETDFLSRLHPGKGVIVSQAFYHEVNQQNASKKMDEGMSPEQIIRWLKANDVDQFPSARQYGIVDFDAANHPRSAAFTGEDVFIADGHRTGNHYVILGNSLLHEAVLDNMEDSFNGTQGSLADKLMAAIQGANFAGADRRCSSKGVSSLFSFLVVARPDDTEENYYVDLGVASVPAGVDPINELQAQFDKWKASISGKQVHQDL
ncbi:DUF1028 domain-containing protein [Endozoicomonas sp. ALD040]|uniref:DUF1028 domain-containing protein n=1 Tax=Endozoicomonas sp. ALD040 TaxID=3403079 RepID=UPI003BB20F85